ncbi:MAG: DUF2723 domain-containing protein [Myxococcales bacterium]|nr:DUF2723 domain-containing protein [Myxococcales bacterium]MCB9533763.1 DUF2723 domain-containing protein [Myxococcales bacterium]
MNADPRQRWLFATTLAITAVTYVSTAARYVLGGDNGEFVSIAMQGGVPHPSGYPAMALYLRAMSWLPGVSPAHTAALATCLLGVAAVAALYGACRAWGASRPSSAVVVTLLATTSLMWKLSSHAEVFALNAAVGAAIVGAAGRHFPITGLRRLALLGLLAGAGLANNHSIVTLAPIGLFAVGRGLSETRARRLQGLGAAAAGLVVGLSPYGYLLIVGRNPAGRLVWGDTGTLKGLLHHFLRADYGTTTLAISDVDAGPLAHIAHLVWRVAVEVHYVPVLFAILGLMSLLRGEGPPRQVAQSGSALVVPAATLHETTVSEVFPRRPFTRRPEWRAVPRLDAWILFATMLTAGPLFISRFNLPLDGLALVIVERFYLLPMTLLAIPIARSLDVLFEHYLSAFEAAGPTVVAVACVGVVLGYDAVREHHRPDVELYLLNTLDSTEPGAVMLGTGDHRVYGFWYATHVIQHRADVTYVDVALLAYPWYRARVEDELGVTLAGIEPGNTQTAAVAASILRTGRPLYMTNRFSDAISAAFPTYPIGTVIRVLPRGDRPPDPVTLERANLELAGGFRFSASEPIDPDSWASSVQPDYSRPWRALADAYDAARMPEAAARCRNRVVVMPRNNPAPATPP